MLSTKVNGNRGLQNHPDWDEPRVSFEWNGHRGADPMATAPQISWQQPACPDVGVERRLKPSQSAVHKRFRVEIV